VIVSRVRPVVRYGFVVAAVGLGTYAVVTRWADVRHGLGRLGYPAVGSALLVVLASLLTTMQGWRVLLAGLGSPLPVTVAGRVFFVSQLGKYIPGSMWPVLAQMHMGSAHRVPPRRSAAAAALTMAISLCTGLALALTTLPLVAAPATAGYRWAFLVMPVLLVGLHPRLLNPFADRLLRLVRRPPLEQPLAGRTVARAVGWALASWLLLGAHVWLLAVRLGAPPGRTVLLALGGYAFAWSVGFLVVVAPAGAGVRDVLLVAMLAPALDVPRATVVALASRALLTLGDLVAAGVAALSAARSGRGSPDPVSAPPAAGTAR
jgi:hypothetical protein